MKKLFFILAISFFVILISFFVIQGFLSKKSNSMNSPLPDSPLSDAKLIEQTITDIQSKLDNHDYDAVYKNTMTLLSGASLNESTRLILINQLVLSTVFEYSKTDFSTMENYGKVVPLYVFLLTEASKKEYPNFYRASVHAQINSVFLGTGFNVPAYIEFLSQTGKLEKYSKNTALDTQNSIVYTALFDFNDEAQALYPDKYNESWQLWLVGASMLESAPTKDLEPMLKEYMRDGFLIVQDHSFETAPTVFHEYWIDQALYTTMSRLDNKYPSYFTKAEDLNKKFELLLNSISQKTPKTGMDNEIEYIVRIAYAAHLHSHKQSSDEVKEILLPLYDINLSIKAPTLFRWLYTHKIDDNDYLLEQLNDISASNKQLRSFLTNLGWSF